MYKGDRAEYVAINDGESYTLNRVEFCGESVNIAIVSTNMFNPLLRFRIYLHEGIEDLDLLFCNLEYYECCCHSGYSYYVESSVPNNLDTVVIDIVFWQIKGEFCGCCCCECDPPRHELAKTRHSLSFGETLTITLPVTYIKILGCGASEYHNGHISYTISFFRRSLGGVRFLHIVSADTHGLPCHINPLMHVRIYGNN